MKKKKNLVKRVTVKLVKSVTVREESVESISGRKGRPSESQALSGQPTQRCESHLGLEPTRESAGPPPSPTGEHRHAQVAAMFASRPRTTLGESCRFGDRPLDELRLTTLAVRRNDHAASCKHKSIPAAMPALVATLASSM